MNATSMIKKINLNFDKKHLIPIISLTVAVILGLTITIILRKPFTVVIDGQSQKAVTYKGTVREALAANKITVGDKDKIEPSLDSRITKKAKVDIKRAVSITVFVEGKEQSYLSAEENIGSMLKAEGITLKTEDKVKPSEDTKLTKDMRIEIVRVETKTLSETSPIEFKTTVKYDKELANNKKRVIQEGKEGQKLITYSVVYEDGKEVTRAVIGEKVVKNPLEKIIVQGTYPLMPVSRGGDPVPYSRVFKARATAYWAVRGVGKTYTASGRKAVWDPDGYSTIAVDPNVIPYGTKLFVEGYGFAIAADAGTGIIGDTIDVYFDTYRQACDWAVKYVNVYVLK